MTLRAPIVATAAAALLVLLCIPALDGQGLNYDEVHQAPAAFFLLGKPAYTFVALAWHRLPLLTMTYSGALKSQLFALWLWGSGVPFSVVSWRLFGIALAAIGLWVFCALTARALAPPALVLFVLLFVSDVTVLLLVRHDWGPVDVALMLRLAWIGLWVRTAKDAQAGPLPLLLLGAIPSLLIYEKLNNVVLAGALAVMMVVADREVRAKRAATMAAGFLVGLVPLALVNVLGHGISFHATVEHSNGSLSAADVAAFVPNVLALGDGDAMRAYILGVHSPPWMRTAELAGAAVSTLFVGAVAWTLGRRNRDAQLAAASLVAYVVTLVLVAALILRISFPYHWLVATPFQYLAAALAAQACARRAGWWSTARLVAPAVVIFLAVRAVNVVGVERDLVARRASLMFDRSNTAVAQYAVAHRDDETFVAADWGFGVQIYALSNGTLSVPEPFWTWGGSWNRTRLEAYLAAPARPVVVLLPKRRPAVSSAATDDILNSVDAMTMGKRLPVDPALASLPAAGAVKFAPPPPPPDRSACQNAPESPVGLRVEANANRFVKVAWEPPLVRPDGYVLDVIAPGASITVEAGRWPMFAADGVAPGTYRLRVRATNRCGVSAPSSELTLVVP